MLILLLVLVGGFYAPYTIIDTKKQYDLVLIHGFNNLHQWGEDFLLELTRHWDSGRIFIIYSNDSEKVWTRKINGKEVVYMGEKDHRAGSDPIHDQTKIVAHKIDYLQKHHGLSSHYSILAHSMGGLVARELAYYLPHEIVDIVTLGTPHHGTPLAQEFEWVTRIVGGRQGVRDLTPEAVQQFNQQYPVATSPFYEDGSLYTISGKANHWGDRGWIGEIAVGWTLLSMKYGKDNDGVVLEGEATLPDANHIATFANCNHFDLIKKPEVAKLVAKYLR